eukprot:2930365-Pyramimonas_sp.AAC.1
MAAKESMDQGILSHDFSKAETGPETFFQRPDSPRKPAPQASLSSGRGTAKFAGPTGQKRAKIS